ncbi:MAG: hypothetical protein JXA52_00405 [Planctomycetes bacterium]|nr:hypothetical protein [Planctomycetota bacterium]
MALAQFRKWEKYIIWVVAILIIPIFAFTFGVGRATPTGKIMPVLRLDGKTVNNTEIGLLAHRMAVLHGMRIPGGKAGYDQLGIFMLQIADARAAGLGVSPAEINTLRRSKFAKYVDKATNQFDWEKYQELLQEMRITPEEMYKAMEEALLLDKFDRLLDNSSLASPYESYLLWAQENSEIICDAVTVKSDDFIAAAREATPDMDAAVQAYLAKNPDNTAFIQPGKWRLEYILSRYDAWNPLPATAKDIKAYFEDPANGYQEKELEAVREEIVAALAQESRGLQARRQLHEVEKTLSHFGTDAMPLTAEKVIQDDLSLQRAYENQKLESGVTGEAPLSLEEIMQNPVIGGSDELIAQLKKLDIPASQKPETEPGKMLARLEQIFNTTQDNFASQQDFSNANGVFKIRIVEYVPGAVRDPATDEAFRKELEDLLLKETAEVLALKQAEALRQQFHDGKAEGIKVESKTLKLVELERNYRELASPMFATGETTQVKPCSDGFEFAVLRGRAVPPFGAFELLPQVEREKYRNLAVRALRRQMQYDYRLGRYTPVLGTRQQMWRVDAMQNRIEHLINWDTAGEAAGG